MIVTVTFNPAVDHTTAIAGDLRSGAVARGERASFDAGGKGINVAQILDALGVETVAAGLLGGFTGGYVRQSLADAGLATAFVSVDGITRVNTTVLADGNEYKLNQPGPAVDPGVADELVARVERTSPDLVAVGGSLPPGLDAAAIDAVAGAGPWEAAVDVGGPLLRDLDGEYALCKPNRAELAAATGLPVDSVDDCVAAARALRERGFRRVVASLGADGAVLVDGDAALHADALDADVADTAGAGDAMLAGVLSAFDGGESAERALRTGVALAARAVETSGTAVPSLDRLDEATSAVAVTEC